MPNPLETWFGANQGRQVNKWPHYFPIYHRHFARYRGTPVHVMEFGVSHGGSLEMWRDYFGPGCRVTGVDIDPRCAALTGPQITILTGDQSDRGFLASLTRQAGPPDIVVDDGGHAMTQQIATLQEVWPQLSDGGTWLTEDTHTSYRPEFGGGYRQPGSFVEYAKDLADRVSAWHSGNNLLQPDGWTRSLAGIHFYNSVIVLDKDTVTRPPDPQVSGRTSF